MALDGPYFLGCLDENVRQIDNGFEDNPNLAIYAGLLRFFDNESVLPFPRAQHAEIHQKRVQGLSQDLLLSGYPHISPPCVAGAKETRRPCPVPGDSDPGFLVRSIDRAGRRFAGEYPVLEI